MAEATTITRQPGEGEELQIGPTRTWVKVGGEASGGLLSVVEMALEGGWAGPPAHHHQRLAHVWWVIEGTVRLRVDDEVGDFEPGACLFVPAGTPHAFSTVGSAGARLLQVDTPMPLDGYFRDLAEAFPPGAPVDPVQVGAIMRRHDTHPVAETG